MNKECPICARTSELPPLAPGEVAECAHCGARLAGGQRAMLAKTLIFSLAALALYVPANVLPIMSMRKLGLYSENTILSGCAELLQHGYWGVALIVFVASILLPLLKLLGLLYLALTPTASGLERYKMRVYRVIHGAGPWSMLDVFLVAIMVSLVKLGDVASVSPEPGLAAFAGVVVLTMLASSAFDPRAIWQGTARA